MDLPLPLSLRKLGLWHGLVWVLRLEGSKTHYLYLAPNPINAVLLCDSSPKEEYPEATDQLGTLALTLKDVDLKKLVFHPETSIVSLYFSDRRILHLHFAGAHATLLDECGVVEATSCKKLKAKEAYNLSSGTLSRGSCRKNFPRRKRSFRRLRKISKKLKTPTITADWAIFLR